MKKLFVMFLVLVIHSPMNAGEPPLYVQSPVRSSLQFLAGYNNGLGLFAHYTIRDFAQGFPMSLRAGIGYTSMDPGSPLDARGIFINNNENGTPEKRGRSLDLQLDFMYQVDILNMDHASVYGGVRHSRFLGNFNFIGGNEDFDIIHNSWGLGTGLHSLFPVTQTLHFTIDMGVNYIFPNTMEGHGTAYNPDGEHVDPREDYTYNDADNAINQPKFQVQLLIGATLDI